MTVKKETAQIRPFVVCAILRNAPRALEKVLLRLMLVGTPVVLQKKAMEKFRSVLERAVEVLVS